MKKLCKKIPRFVKVIISLIILFLVVWFWPAGVWPANPLQEPVYGATFSAKYARELNLDPKEVYEAMLRDLNIDKIRLVAYWDEIEKEQGIYDFSDLDWQIEMSKKYGAEIVLSIGRRVPRWPECHIPNWANQIPKSEKYEHLKEYIGEVVNRHKDNKLITHWQIENEAFFTVYAPHICGDTANAEVIDEEIALVRQLDPSRQIIMTDSGNLGIWSPAYKRADIFGSTFYVYLMNDGKLRTPLTHNFYKLKNKLWETVHGKRDDVWLIEISVEPYLTKPILDTDVDELVDRLSLKRVETILDFAKDTGFTTQYLWGIEWHYYMLQNGHSEYWDYMKEVFQK
jgi:hypothetical protein